MWEKESVKVKKSVEKIGLNALFLNFNPISYNRNIYCYADWEGGKFQNRIPAPTTWYQNPYDASMFLHAWPNLRKKFKKNPSNFKPKFDLPLESFPPKMQRLIQIFYMAKRLWL